MRKTLAVRIPASGKFIPDRSAPEFAAFVSIRVEQSKEQKHVLSPLRDNDQKDQNLMTLALNSSVNIDRRKSSVQKIETLPVIQILIDTLKKNPGDKDSAEYEFDCREMLQRDAEVRKNDIFYNVTDQKDLERIARNHTEELEYREKATVRLSDPDVLDEILDDLSNPFSLRNLAGARKSQLIRTMNYPGEQQHVCRALRVD